ncbi:hypothetical protein R50073_40180 [Maricurvus nonylphenolicus]|uniref:AraC family transcriptional regulator n=1 Tax=Maricurvus nonylphenolicus TaxID=1008307 RepID=UPI0036F44B7A
MKKLIGGQDPLFPWVLHPNYLFEYGLELGISPTELLANTGISEKDLEDVDLLISWQQYRTLADNLALKGHADWGFEFGLRLPVASHGLLGLLALNCVTWEQVIEIQESYPILISPIFYVIRRDSEEFCYITVHPEFTRDPILDRSMEAYFSMNYRAIEQMGGGSIKDYGDNFFIFVKGDPPPYHRKLRTFYGGNIEWNNHVNQIRIRKELLSTPIPNANPIAANATRRMLQAQLNQMSARKGGLNELRELFVKGVYKQEECAKQLYTTLPTFKRYLKGACTTFSRELAMFRIDEAAWLAANSIISMAELSDRLGFQDVNSFGRLFKNELGVSFSEYRKAHQS